MHDGEGMAQVRPAHSPDGVHLLRTSQQIQYQLSQMADTKANMLLGITFLIFTISVGQAREGHETAPLLLLGGSAFVAAMLAITAVLPSFKAAPMPSGTHSLLFFGSFAQLEEDDFVARLTEIAKSTPDIHEAFARDIYQHGRVLATRKYRLLNWAYRVLLTGLIASFTAFIGGYVLQRFGG